MGFDWCQRRAVERARPRWDFQIGCGWTTRHKAARMRLTRRVTRSEWPPSAKKLSSRPTRPTPKVSAKSEQRSSSRGVLGARRALVVAVKSGVGSALRSSLPLG